MAFIDFTESELVNVKDIDNQHLKMVNIINRIHSGISNTSNYNYTSDLQALIDEIEIHFETEERYMKENLFPGYYSHKLEHDRFFNQMVNNFEKMKEDRSSNIGEQLNSFKRWFYNHLDLSDKKCGTFLNSKGIL